MANDVKQNTDGFATMHDLPANNDADRARAVKKGHGYPVPSPKAPGPTPFQQGRVSTVEGDGLPKASLDGSMSHASHDPGAPYVGSPGAKGAHAPKRRWGQES